jgi:dolichol-phosphate mannosyltransferase
MTARSTYVFPENVVDEAPQLTVSSERAGVLVSLDIVVPLYNEEEVLPFLVERLDSTFADEHCRAHGIGQVSLIFVDDGSRDGSVAVLRRLLRARPQFNSRIIRLSRNFGHQSAVSAGVDHSTSDVTAVIDADLQDAPEVIREMLDKWRSGYDVVYAQRASRQEYVLKRMLYWGFYRLYHVLSPIDVALDSGDFCLMSRQVVEELRKLPESVRFPRGLRSWVGFPQAGVEYDRPARAAGKTRYSLGQLYELATDGITSISIRPLKLAQLIGLSYFVLSLGALGLLLTNLTTQGSDDRRFVILLAVMLFSNSLVLFCLYIIGAYVGRAYLESKRRPTYIIRDVLGGGGGEP